MSDFLEKLKKGMNADEAKLESFEEEAEEEAPLEESKEEIQEEESEEIEEEINGPDFVEGFNEIKPVEADFAVVKATPSKKKKKTSRKKTTESSGKIKIKEEAPSKRIKDKNILREDGQLTVDVFETEKDLIIQSAVAGVDAKDLDISIEKDMVSIRGERERNIEEESENFFYQECYWGSFSREVVLPAEVDSSKAEASMKDGVLTIRMPKVNPEQTKKINIKSID
jgi:HSP20 family protein